MAEKILVALGGNALIKPGQEGTIQEQTANLNEVMAQLVEIIKEGHQVIITHGNGPQVGHILIRVEEARQKAYDIPLDVCVAQSQGEMGYLIQQQLCNLLARHKMHRPIATILSQVVVDKHDPQMNNPSKPIGPFFSKEQGTDLQKRGYTVFEDAHRGYRRVAPSPLPMRILESDTIRQLCEQGTIVIAAGGGGIPVSFNQEGLLEGIEAVVDKDWASSVLAIDLGVECMLNLTGVEHAKLHFGLKREENLKGLTIQQAKTYLAEGHFLPGSMKPKIESAIHFLEHGGKEVIITSPDKALDGFYRQTGTHLSRESRNSQE